MENTENYLECERNRVYYTLIAIAGFFGAYTFLLRGKVFCNAQTGNLVLLGLAIGQAEWETAAYYLFPISAYMAGAFISELLPNPVKYHLKIRWDTLLIAVEMATVPNTTPNKKYTTIMQCLPHFSRCFLSFFRKCWISFASPTPTWRIWFVAKVVAIGVPSA